MSLLFLKNEVSKQLIVGSGGELTLIPLIIFYFWRIFLQIYDTSISKVKPRPWIESSRFQHLDIQVVSLPPEICNLIDHVNKQPALIGYQYLFI